MPEYDSYIQAMNEKLNKSLSDCDEKDDNITVLNEQIVLLNREDVHKKEVIANLEAQLDSQNGLMLNVRNEIQEKTDEFNDFISAKEKELENLKIQLQGLVDENEAMNSERQDLLSRLNATSEEGGNREETIEHLQSQVQELEQCKNREISQLQQRVLELESSASDYKVGYIVTSR